jgi:hypothetical protein
MKFIGIIISILLVVSCAEVGNAPQLEPESDCDALIDVVGDNRFNATVDTDFSIENVSIDQDCLSISIADSGCNPDNWEVNLLTTSAVLESLPVQKSLKVEVINDEACLAVFQKTKSFDLTPIQIEGESEIILNIEGWDMMMVYTY